MGFLDKMERRFGRFAIPNLMLYLCIFYLGGFVLYQIDPGFYMQHLCLNMERIFAGEIWRLITFIIDPPSTRLFGFALYVLVFYSLGTSLERLWGRFYFNLYVFIGLFAMILTALLAYVIGRRIFIFTPYDLYMSFLLAIGITIPDTVFYFYMIIPIKAKYLTIFYGVLIAIRLVTGSWAERLCQLACLANFLIFVLFIRKPHERIKQFARKAAFTQKVRTAEKNAASAKGGARHRCAVCGRTELDDPSLEFRYCSKCTGGKEYCMEHLYTHRHE